MNEKSSRQNDPELRCIECGWTGDFYETKGTTECPICWNDYCIVTANEQQTSSTPKELRGQTKIQ